MPPPPENVTFDTYGFNEAPAVLPGKIRGSPPVARANASGFNEAPAVLPGKIAVGAFGGGAYGA